ncbi:hypothetical protein DRQ25_16605, partial [Candidatus Fermentibacteria bacterium]
MPNRDDGFSFLKGAAIAAPLGIGASLSFRGMADKGYFKMPQAPSSPAFLSNLRQMGLQSNQGTNYAEFFGNNQLLFKKEPELARTAWVQAVQATDPMAQEVLSFGGDFKAVSPGKVVSSIEQTLQRNNSIFMARIYNKFRSNVSVLRKHYEVTGKIPKFKAVEGLSFPAPRNTPINQLPASIAAFHEKMIKDTGVTAAGPTVKYYTRKGWAGYGTYVMPFMKDKMPFEVTVPMSRKGTLMEGLTQSARRVAPGAEILDPRSGAVERLSRHEFYLKDIERSVLPGIKSGAYKSGWEIEKALGQVYEKRIGGLDAIPNFPTGEQSEAWKSYARIKGQSFDIVTEGKLAELRPGESYRSVFKGPTEGQFKSVFGRSDVFPFTSPKNLAQGRGSYFNAADWYMTGHMDWSGQPRQINRHWRASDKAVSEMLSSGSAKWSIFETQAWRRDFGHHAAPWVPTIYVDPVKHGAVLEQLGMKEGEGLIASKYAKQLEVVGKPYPIHLGHVVEGVAERIKTGEAFKVGEVLGEMPGGGNVVYEKGMKLLGLEPFETVGKGQEFALKYELTLPSEIAAKRFDPKGTEKLMNAWDLEKGVAEMTKDLPPEQRYQFTKYQGNVRLASMDVLKYQQALNTQKITGLHKLIKERHQQSAYGRSSRMARFLENPVGVTAAMSAGKTGPEFLGSLERLARDAGLSKGQFGAIFGEGTSGLSMGISQSMFHDPMKMTGAGALGSLEPRIFDVLKGGQFGPLGEEISAELAGRLAYTNPGKLAAYEGLTKTLASYEGMLTPGKAGIGWDVTTKGYTQKGFQGFIESGGGFMKIGAGQKDIFVPGGDVLTPYKTAAGKLIPGDVAMEYHGLARDMAKLHIQSKRAGLGEAGKIVDGFITNIQAHQAPFGSGVGAVARGQVAGSRFLRAISKFKGKGSESVGTAIIPEYMGYQMLEELEALPGMDAKKLTEMGDRLRAGKSVGGLTWRHPLAGPYSMIPMNIQMSKDITEAVISMPSKMIDIGMGNPIELSPMVGMGADRDA